MYKQLIILYNKGINMSSAMFKHCCKTNWALELPLKPEAQPRVLMEAPKAQEVLNKMFKHGS